MTLVLIWYNESQHHVRSPKPHGALADELLHLRRRVGVEACHDAAVAHLLGPLTLIFQPQTSQSDH